jgi:hypothetical protein
MFVKRLFVSFHGFSDILFQRFCYDIDKDKVNSFVSERCNLLIDSAKTTFGTHKYKTRPDTCNKKPKGDKPWFNYECKVAILLLKAVCFDASHFLALLSARISLLLLLVD